MNHARPRTSIPDNHGPNERARRCVSRRGSQLREFAATSASDGHARRREADPVTSRARPGRKGRRRLARQDGGAGYRLIKPQPEFGIARPVIPAGFSLCPSAAIFCIREGPLSQLKRMPRTSGGAPGLGCRVNYCRGHERDDQQRHDVPAVPTLILRTDPRRG